MKSIRKTLGGIRRSRAADRERRECAKRVAAAAGWSEERAMKALLGAEAKGISFRRYEENSYWKLEGAALDREIERQERLRKKREGYIDEVVKASGWTRDDAVKAMRKAKAGGVSYGRYAGDGLYVLDEDGMSSYMELAAREQEAGEDELSFYARIAAVRSGWSHDRVVSEMENASKRGVSYADFVLREGWRSGKPAGTDRQGATSSVVGYASSITGMDRPHAAMDMMRAYCDAGADAADYTSFGMHTMDRDVRRTMATRKLRDRMIAMYNENCMGEHDYGSRLNFFRNFAGETIHRWEYGRFITLDEFRDDIEGIGRIRLRSIDAKKDDEKIFDCSTCSAEEIFNDMRSRGEVLVEEVLPQEKISGSVRVMTLAYRGECRILSALHYGKSAEPVDTSTGRTPSGYDVPMWDDIAEMCGRLTGRTPGTCLVSWDIALTDRGPDLMGGDHEPSFIEVQEAWLKEGRGMSPLMAEPYLQDGDITVTEKGSLMERKRRDLAERVRAMTDDDTEGLEEKAERALTLGIKEDRFIYYRGWRFTLEELEELSRLMDMRRRKTKKMREWYVKTVAERSGCTEEKASARLRAMRKKGYTSRKFITSGLFRLDDEELEKVVPYSGSSSPGNIFVDDIFGEEFDRILEERGLTWAGGVLEALRSKIVAGAEYGEWVIFGLWKKPAEAGLDYITMDVHLKMQLRYCDYMGKNEIFRDKIKFNTVFSSFIGRKWLAGRDISREEFREKTEGLGKIIVKPVGELGGEGIVRYDLSGERDMDEIYDEIAARGEVIIEESIEGRQTPVIREMWPGTLNTIRVFTLNRDGDPLILASLIKVGSEGVADNLHQGGVAAAIDIETGIICTDAVDMDGNVYETHMKSGKPFRGVQIPHWDRLIEVVKGASKVVESMPYIGWDVSILEDGSVEIIEGNHDPMATMMQYPYAASEDRGVGYMFRPYTLFGEE